MHYQYKENRYRCSVYVAAEEHHHRLPYSFPSSFLSFPCQVKPTRKRNKICSSELIDAWYWRALLSCKIAAGWEDGGVESIENLYFSCSEGPPSSNALPISFNFIDFALWGHTDKEYHSLFRTHSCMILTNTTLMKGKVMIRGWHMYEKMDGLTYSHLWCGN